MKDRIGEEVGGVVLIETEETLWWVETKTLGNGWRREWQHPIPGIAADLQPVADETTTIWLALAITKPLLTEFDRGGALCYEPTVECKEH